MYAENPKQFNKTYRIQIAHTEQEIDTIIWMGVFCGNKTGFVRPGHKLSHARMFSHPKILFLVSLLFVALFNPTFLLNF